MMENRHMAVRLPGQTRKILSVYITFLVFLIATVAVDPQIFSSGNRLWALSLQYAPLMLCAMSQTACMLVGGINHTLTTPVVERDSAQVLVEAQAQNTTSQPQEAVLEVTLSFQGQGNALR